MALIKVCKVDDVPLAEMRQCQTDETEILVVNLDHQFYCLDARCTHAGAPLSDGELNGKVLSCPWHGSQFDVTDGHVLKGPADQALRVYPAKILAGDLYIEV
jgi:nitrite reductase (NADH) small subunit/3-phenylpropionate/trans-cinnamate dioxygenase ferredoxin subunit